MRRLVAIFIVIAAWAAVASAPADPPGAGDKQCVPGQNNIGGGPGNSGSGDQAGAPLKIKSCPGGG
jgi:hypothetical protein